MGDKTLSITRLLDHNSMDMAITAVESSEANSPSKSSIGQWARLLQVVSHTELPLSTAVTDNAQGEDNENSLRASIQDRQAKLDHWTANVPSHGNASECSLSMTMRSSLLE